MNICLRNISGLINDGIINSKIRFSVDMFRDSVHVISKDIAINYDTTKIGLVGIARGGLPLLVSISHELGIRHISIVQIEMTNSDKQWDYGTARFYNGYIDESYNEYLLFEDMVSQGRSVNLVIKNLINKNKCVSAVYSLCMNQEMNNITLVGDTVVKYMYMTSPKQWINFFWEKGYEV